MPRRPSVLAQGFPASFVQHEPLVRNYNSGLTRKGFGEYLATRRFNRDTWRNEIVINRLTDGRAMRVCTLDLPRAHGMEHFEDARLFWHNSRIHCAYTEGQYWNRPWVAVQKLALLNDDWSVDRVVTIPFGENSYGTEKNWQFFSHNDALHFVYSMKPHVVVELGSDYQPRTIHTTRAVMAHQYRGGTPPVRVGDRYFSFPHYHVTHAKRHRRYGFSCYAFAAEAPFPIVGISDPLVVGSDDDPTLPNLAYPHWQPVVVFPCGAILNDQINRGGTWKVCAGINDSHDVIFKIPADQIRLRAPRRLYASTSPQV